VIEPSQLADAWYLKFGYEWVARPELDEDWNKIAETLMRNDYLRYELSQWIVTGRGAGVTEILKLKGD